MTTLYRDINRDEATDLLDDLTGYHDELFEWEQNFVEDLTEKIDEGRRVTDGQLDKLREIHGRVF